MLHINKYLQKSESSIPQEASLMHLKVYVINNNPPRPLLSFYKKVVVVEIDLHEQVPILTNPQLNRFVFLPKKHNMTQFSLIWIKKFHN